MKSVHQLWKQKVKEGWSDDRFKEELIKNGHIISSQDQKQQDELNEKIDEYNCQWAEKNKYRGDGLRKE